MPEANRATSLGEAIAALLRCVPDLWEPVPDGDPEALARLTAAGFIERRVTFTIKLPGDDKPQRITIELTGEYGLAEAMAGVVQDLWARCGERWRELRAETGEPIKPIVALERDEWRMTDQGRSARDDLERDATVPIDFALKRGFFNSRGPVRGQGRLVRIENAASGPLAVDLAKCSAAPEIAQALAAALSGVLAAVKPPVNATPEADVFALERFGDGWRIEAFGERGHFQDLRGLRYIAKLLQKPNVAIPVELLVRDESAMPARKATVDHGELGAGGRGVQHIADEEALEAYRQRWEELRDEIAEAESEGRAAEVEELQRQLKVLADIIKEARGLGDSRRAFASVGDKLRPSVHGALKRVYQRMREAKPAMKRTAEHLELSIECGKNAFTYRGVSLPNWRIVL
jgi:hypothetical protein